jgi:hypothetical protein
MGDEAGRDGIAREGEGGAAKARQGSEEGRYNAAHLAAGGTSRYVYDIEVGLTPIRLRIGPLDTSRALLAVASGPNLSKTLIC